MAKKVDIQIQEAFRNYIDEKKANSIDKTKVYTLTNKGMLSTYVLITIITILSIIIGLLVYFE